MTHIREKGAAVDQCPSRFMGKRCMYEAGHEGDHEARAEGGDVIHIQKEGDREVTVFCGKVLRPTSRCAAWTSLASFRVLGKHTAHVCKKCIAGVRGQKGAT